MEFLHKPTAQAAELMQALAHMPSPGVNTDRPLSLLSRCPVAGETPLEDVPELAKLAGVGQVYVKDERARMGLGSFKALGAAYVIATDAQKGDVSRQTYVTASAGNHGLSVAAGAQAFGAHAVIFLAETVPEVFADRLRGLSAEVRRHGAIYEDSMAGAAAVAEESGWILLSDSSWEGYCDKPHTLMEGYLVLMHEAVIQIPEAPSHIFLQAGVGGLAAASAAYARKAWGTEPRIIVVEPDAAPAIFASIKAGSPQITTGPSSQMGRLDCKEPSLIALKGLAKDADDFVLITEADGEAGSAACASAGYPSTPSGAAGFSGLMAAQANRDAFGLTDQSRVLIILSEEAT